MPPERQTIAALPNGDAFSFAARWWLFVLITFLIPMDLLYRSASFMEAMTWPQLVQTVAALVSFFALLSLSLALGSMALARLLNHITAQGTRWVDGLNAALGSWFLITLLFGYMLKWVVKIFNMPWTMAINPKWAAIISVIGLTIVVLNILYDKSFQERIRSIASACYKFNIIVAVMGGLIFTIIAGYTLLDRRHEKKQHYHNVANAAAKYPNIIIITFDALAAGHTPLYGYHLDTTPNLRKLAQESYVFDHFFASSNFTPPALSSLLTGKHPVYHHIINDYSFYSGAGRNENLPTLLMRAGYHTMAVCAVQFGAPWNRNMEGFQQVSPVFSNSRLAIGLSRFFFAFGSGAASWVTPLIRESPLFLAARYFKRPGKSGAPSQPQNSLGVYAPEQTLAAASALLKDAKSPFFLWVHILPPHDPYAPRSDFLYTFLKEKIFDGPQILASDVAPDNRYPLKDQPTVDKLARRYDEHILYADHEVGKFLNSLRQSGLWDNSIIMVSADHGEMFAKGFLSHCGPYLYQPLIHVPLLLRLPGQTQGGRVAANVSQTDLAPTVLDLLGLKPPAWMDGRSVKDALKNPPMETGAKFSMNLSHWGDPADCYTRSIAAIRGAHKLIYYIELDRYEMFDLRRDPGEEDNLADKEPELFQSLKKELAGMMAR
jgi:arylsulfatase A-like enzyme